MKGAWWPRVSARGPLTHVLARLDRQVESDVDVPALEREVAIKFKINMAGKLQALEEPIPSSGVNCRVAEYLFRASQSSMNLKKAL